MLYPTDSLGRVCGRRDFSTRPYLLFFDLTRCLNPAVLALGCPTPQVCVAECPKQKFSMYAEARRNPDQDFEIKSKMRPYCTEVSCSLPIGTTTIDVSQPGLQIRSKYIITRLWSLGRLRIRMYYVVIFWFDIMSLIARLQESDKKLRSGANLCTN